MNYRQLRKDHTFTKPLISDEEFFMEVLDSGRPGLEVVQACIQEQNWPRARSAYLDYVEATSRERYFFGNQDVPGLAAFIHDQYQPEAYEPILAEAKRVVDLDIPLYGSKRMKFEPGAVDWNGSFHDSSQHQLFLTRFGYVLPLARAYLLTGDEAYAMCYNDLMASFIAECPVPKDDTFLVEHCSWEPLTTGIRMFMWPEAFIIFLSSESFLPEVRMTVIKSFYEHADYIARYHTKHGNHATMQLRGLFYTSLLFPEFKASAGWRTYTLEVFPGYIMQNVYEDGIQFEASPTYHMTVLRDVMEFVELCKRHNLRQGEGLVIVLEKMLEAVMHLRTPAGELPRFGDTDVIGGAQLTSVMSNGARLFGRADFKAFGEAKLPVLTALRVGPEEAARYAAMEARPPEALAAVYAQGGYMLARGGWDPQAMYVAMRSGGGVGGHVHADALSLVISAFGRELLVDSGKGVYEWDAVRKYIISTRAHNTVVVDGQNQYVRNLHWDSSVGAPAKVWDHRSNERYEFFFASHYGYTRYDDPVIHSRKVLFVKNRYCVVMDIMQAEKPHTYELYYHLPPGDVGTSACLKRIHTLAEGQANVMLLRADGGDQVNATLESGLFYYDQTYSPKPVVKYTQLAGHATFVTVLIPYEDRKPEVAEVRTLGALVGGREAKPWEVTALEVELDGETERICVNHLSVKAESFLDATGNPVAADLIPDKRDSVEVEFEGMRFATDVVLL
ncbi:hypothetical protein SY83_13420 [Paenibacillus swuensis]|uniref:Uncharacterized protein n=1 Tax=Paenibacillus swuensis TaxID=1178515 RepID=A0A172TJ61_9BACL|nr:alginate lyase family protein [Paenibacillus swuensis]ANE47095.1 hypothetical protein SY83_13420 [Paenibacillus swuensis]